VIKRALELDENSAIAHAVYSEILVDLGNYDAAAEESRLALELDPSSLEVRRARGYVLYWTSNYELAANEYKAALAINDKIPNLHLMLGYIYGALGEYDQAVAAFNQANALNPPDPIPDYEASRIYFGIGEFARAVQYAEQAVKDDPTDPNLHGNLGIMYAKNSQGEEAIDQLALAVHGGTTEDNHIVEGLPLSYELRTIEIYSTYSLTLARQNRCGEAIPIFQVILSVVPDNEIAVYNAETGLDMCQENLKDSGVDTGG
jgi:tetratricopeptide (TPR) repeat protein